MEGVLIRGGRGGEKGEGVAPVYYGFPPDRGARIVTGYNDSLRF